MTQLIVLYFLYYFQTYLLFLSTKKREVFQTEMISVSFHIYNNIYNNVILKIFMCMGNLVGCVSVYHMHAGPSKVREGVEIPGP